MDRADVTEYIDYPPPEAIYEILRSSLKELMAKGIVAELVKITLYYWPPFETYPFMFNLRMFQPQIPPSSLSELTPVMQLINLENMMQHGLSNSCPLYLRKTVESCLVSLAQLCLQ